MLQGHKRSPLGVNKSMTLPEWNAGFVTKPAKLGSTADHLQDRTQVEDWTKCFSFARFAVCADEIRCDMPVYLLHTGPPYPTTTGCSRTSLR